MTKIEKKCIDRSRAFTNNQLVKLEVKAKMMTVDDDDPQEYYYALALLLSSEREDYLYGREDRRLTTGEIK